ncbi:MAG TPA: enterotoxin [Candidatus Limnocylindrales bacterium]|nr:enterotoxin [Candidatus Limnocylindrales bacterium]
MLPSRGNTIVSMHFRRLTSLPIKFAAVGALTSLLIASPVRAQQNAAFFSQDPGPAHATVNHGIARLANSSIDSTWRFDANHLTAAPVHDVQSAKSLPLGPDIFVLLLADGRVFRSSQMRIIRDPSVSLLVGDSAAARLAERLSGKSISADLADESASIHVLWRAELRDGSNYVRQEFTIEAQQQDVSIHEIRLVDSTLAESYVSGRVRGSPVVAGNFFLGFEHPLSQCTVAATRALCGLERQLPLRAGRQMSYSSVIGVAPQGQLRRAFLYYLERERAHPYRTFLHYNSWYDLGYFTPYTDSDALAVIRAFGSELHDQRGVNLSSFLFDDGWDNPASLWNFGSGFPQGFSNLRKAAEQFGAEPGIWFSPWGGYGQPRQKRIATATAAGYETNNSGLALSGPKYFALFRQKALEMVQKYGVNQFKFDGTGNANQVVPGSDFNSDFDAAISLIGELRTAKPSIYINLTTGTYPSPFWLRYADSIWRGGEDHSFAGVGSNRQRWITYRDAATYRYVARDGPLFPLNSLMLHGLIFAQHADKLDTDPNGDFTSELHDYFGTGTQLQEMYITPALLKPADWDHLAESARWSAANVNTLVDTHWVGGDPAELEIYGWASWSPTKGILVLRNPSDHEQSTDIDVATAFELPHGAAQRFTAVSPWKDDAAKSASPLTLAAGQPHHFTLAPFEVLTLEATPIAQPPTPPARPKKH